MKNIIVTNNIEGLHKYFLKDQKFILFHYFAHKN